jgi:hypothetical protein
MSEYGEVGSTSPGPVFPRYGEQWFECYICGFDFPLSEARRHYKSNRLVDMACDDEKTHSDYMAEREIPREEPIETEQPVTCQGPAVDDTWYGGLWNEMEWYGKGDPCETQPVPPIGTLPPTETLTPGMPTQPGTLTPGMPVQEDPMLLEAVWTYNNTKTEPPQRGQIRYDKIDTFFIHKTDQDGFYRGPEMEGNTLPMDLLVRGNDESMVTFTIGNAHDKGTYYAFQGHVTQGDPELITTGPVLLTWLRG